MKDNTENKGPLVRIIRAKLNGMYYIQIKRTDGEWHETANGPFDLLANARSFEKGMHDYLESAALMHPCNDCFTSVPLHYAYQVEVAQCIDDQHCYLAYCKNCGLEIEGETMDEAVSQWNLVNGDIDKDAGTLIVTDKAFDDIPF
jgi:hypothetical protein